MMRAVRLFLLFSILFISVVSGQNLKITLANNTEAEIKTKQKLLRVLEEYDVKKWIYTDSLVISEKVDIPFSHPVITLNTEPQSDLSYLAGFIHENIHWYIRSKKREGNVKAIKELQEKFPEVPVGKGQGAGSRMSTYFHLIVNYFEYDAIKQLAGERAARAVIKNRYYYKWIYKQILEDTAYFEALMKKHHFIEMTEK